MVTDGGQIIRTPVDQVSIVGRGARGVRLFNVAEDEERGFGLADSATRMTMKRTTKMRSKQGDGCRRSRR